MSFDNKYKIKCGEPSHPVAAAERGKKVVVGENQMMSVGDHEFTKFSLIPSVHLTVRTINNLLFLFGHVKMFQLSFE